jgi:hypothetical protein
MTNWLRRALILSVLLVCLGAQRGDHDLGGDLRQYAVRVIHGLPGEIDQIAQTGNAGLYLGRGLVLTAAHVAGHQLSPFPLHIVAGRQLVPAKFVKAGAYEKTDVTLLSVDTETLPVSMRSLPPLKLCRDSPVPGQPVVVAEQRGLTFSIVVSPLVLPANLPTVFGTLIRDVDTTGNSGSGVFDEASGCLMGIMSRKIEWTNGYEKLHEQVKYFVPAAEIRAFLGPIP